MCLLPYVTVIIVNDCVTAENCRLFNILFDSLMIYSVDEGIWYFE